MILYLVIAVTLIIIDQLTKAWVVTAFESVGDTIPIINNFFHFTYVRNPGAVFGLGGDSGYNYLIFIGFGIIAIGLFSYMFITNNWKDRRKIIYNISLALLVAGTMGNFIDRIFQPDHRVVDFLDFRGIWDYVFNVADMCLTVGISLFMFDQFILDPKRVKADANRV